MAYSKNNLTMLSSFVGSGPKVWLYSEGSVSLSALTGSGYISDGVTCGMAVGDLVHAVDAAGPKYKLLQVASVSGAAATLAAPTAIT